VPNISDAPPCTALSGSLKNYHCCLLCSMLHLYTLVAGRFYFIYRAILETVGFRQESSLWVTLPVSNLESYSRIVLAYLSIRPFCVPTRRSRPFLDSIDVVLSYPYGTEKSKVRRWKQYWRGDWNSIPLSALGFIGTVVRAWHPGCRLSVISCRRHLHPPRLTSWGSSSPDLSERERQQRMPQLSMQLLVGN